MFNNSVELLISLVRNIDLAAERPSKRISLRKGLLEPKELTR